MADLTVLLRRLEDYASELDRHAAEVQNEFETVRRSLTRLSGVYEGTAASDFKAHWSTTQQRLRQYVEGTQSIRSLLRERIDALREADRTGGL